MGPRPKPRCLFDNLRNSTSADRASTFANGEALVLVHRDRRDQLDLTSTLSPGMHISAPTRVRSTGHVRGAEVELRPVAAEERRVTAPFVLAQA